jgi:hypothetical protein
MASSEPFDQLTGTLKVFIGPVGETVPNVNSVPSGNWYELGETDGEQSIQHMGGLTYFSDNAHQGKVKAVRPEEDVVITFTLVGLTVENYARVLSTVGAVFTSAGPPAIRRLSLKRGKRPTEYAMLFKGEALSPYGLYPGMYVIPRGVMDGEPTATFAKDGRPALEIEFHALEDDHQGRDEDKLEIGRAHV